MDQKQLFKQMFEFNKTTFNNSFNALSLLQDQMERVATTVLDQATWLPEDGRKAINDWVSSFKSAREEFKKQVDDNYKKVEEFFVS